MGASRTRLKALILWAIAWASAMIASAILLKNNPIKDWVQAALFIAAMTFWVWQSRRASRKGNAPSKHETISCWYSHDHPLRSSLVWSSVIRSSTLGVISFCIIKIDYSGNED